MAITGNFEQRLKGGHPNSLGNTIEVVEEVLANTDLFEELFNCYQSDDEIVRLRTSNGIKRVCKANKALVLPYIDRLINDISTIDQASTQWTLAQLFLMLQSDLNPDQKAEAKEIMKTNLSNSNDWIVLNMTIETLGRWAKKDDELRSWLVPHLEKYAKDDRKSVAKKADKTLQSLS